ncbi:response regulator [Verrucomicrobiota bacterium]
MKNILIVEDETLVAQGLAQIVRRKMNETVSGVDLAQSAEDCIANMGDKEYDLVLIDIRLPDMTGPELAEYVRQHHPKTRILMISALCTPFICYQLTRLKVDGFVHKLESMETFVNAISSVLAGEPSFCSNFIAENRRLNTVENSFTKLLGDRELQVLQYFVTGMRDSDIAERMNISVRTVETHRYNMLKKLDLPDKAALRQYAEDMGIF